jgi:hypothetical protein
MRGSRVGGSFGYVPNTNVLRTRFEQNGCVCEIIDFAPKLPEPLDMEAPFELVRLITPVQEQPRLRVDFDPRPDFGELLEARDGTVRAWT